jgi:hypothetical protein
MERVYLLDLKCGWDFRSPETGIPHFLQGEFFFRDTYIKIYLENVSLLTVS